MRRGGKKWIGLLHAKEGSGKRYPCDENGIPPRGNRREDRPSVTNTTSQVTIGTQLLRGRTRANPLEKKVL